MDEIYKEKIEVHWKHLMEKTEFPPLWREFIIFSNASNYFSESSEQKILSAPNDLERKILFYTLIQNCDKPTVFKSLCNALSRSGQNELSLLLLDNKHACQLDSVVTNEDYLPPIIKEVRVRREPSITQSCSKNESKYLIQSSPSGYVLLMNMRFYNNPLVAERLGSEKDVSLLKELFTQLGYKIVEKHNLTLDGMQSALQDFINMSELREVDSIIVFVMSHGRNPAERDASEPLKSPGSESVDIELEDNRFINSNQIVDLINSSPFIRRNIPRLFFFNVCRGEKIDWGMGYDTELDMASSGAKSYTSPHVDQGTRVDARPTTTPHPVENHLLLNDEIVPPTSSTHAVTTPTPSSPSHTSNNNSTLPVNTNLRLNMKEVTVRRNGAPNQSYDEVHSNGVNNVPFNGNANNSDIHSLHNSFCCCCFCSLPHRDKDKRGNVLVRFAFCLARALKCSMPVTDTADDFNVVVSNPGGLSLPNDSPDTDVTHGVLWRDMENEQPVIRSSSGASRASLQNMVVATGHMIEKVVHSIIPERLTRNKLIGDVFIAFSTVHGYNSKRHTERGSWFVTLIVKVFQKRAKDTDLITMMEEVDRGLRQLFDSRYGTQMYVCKKVGFSKRFYFNVDQGEESDRQN